MGSVFAHAESLCLSKDDPRDPYSPDTYAEEERITDEELLTGPKYQWGGTELRAGYVSGDIILFDNTVPAAAVLLDRFLERQPDPYQVLWSVAKYAQLGAVVEVNTVHWLHNQAMAHGRKHTVGPDQVEQWLAQIEMVGMPPPPGADQSDLRAGQGPQGLEEAAAPGHG